MNKNDVDPSLPHLQWERGDEETSYDWIAVAVGHKVGYFITGDPPTEVHVALDPGVDLETYTARVQWLLMLLGLSPEESLDVMTKLAEEMVQSWDKTADYSQTSWHYRKNLQIQQRMLTDTATGEWTFQIVAVGILPAN